MDVLKDLIDDKSLVIICTTILALAAMGWMGMEAKEIVTNVVSGLMGIAVGRSMK